MTGIDTDPDRLIALNRRLSPALVVEKAIKCGVCVIGKAA